MPLHDWTKVSGWDGMHHLWITELLRWVKPRLPAGYRAYIGTAPVLAIGAPAGRPDVGVHSWSGSSVAESGFSSTAETGRSDGECEPDIELAVATIDPNTACRVEKQGRLIAAIELISPRNKDRQSARETYLTRSSRLPPRVRSSPAGGCPSEADRILVR